MASGKTTSPHEKYFSGLSPDEKTLLTLRDELYGGSWEQMLGDLTNRLEGKPYIFRLVNRIKDDIERIRKLGEYERKNRVNLNHYAKKEEAR